MAYRVLIAGNPEPVHIGAHLQQAAQAMGLPVEICDIRSAYQGNWLQRQFAWRLRGRRPVRLAMFSSETVEACRSFRADCVIATGIAPLTPDALKAMKEIDTDCINYLTDDPWNQAHYAPWFMETLPHYDRVFSTRRANLEDLRQAGCHRVEHLPFAYNPEICLSAGADTSEINEDSAPDVLFVGGADPDRLPYISALVDAGLQVALYGGYWTRYRKTREFAMGCADPSTLARATARAKVALCLVRRANRDGHVMRSFEIPASGGCMLAENTDEHRVVFGEEKDCVVYFNTIDEMIEKVRWLLDHEDERRRLARAAHQRIVQGRHTYQDRLQSMLDA